jgi:hypothetical protein
MVVRHATAFALMGWYLLAPPIPSSASTARTERRLRSDWVRIGTFDTREQCADDQLQRIHSGKGGSELVGSEDELKNSSVLAGALPRTTGGLRECNCKN